MSLISRAASPLLIVSMVIADRREPADVFARSCEPMEMHVFDAEEALEEMDGGPDQLVYWKAGRAMGVAHALRLRHDRQAQ
jgi:hypothetical protein